MSQYLCAVYVNYNSSELLLRSLEALLESPKLDRVIIVDNCSTSAEQKKLSRDLPTDPRISVEYFPKNHGFGGAINRAVFESHLPQDTALWFINPDTLVDGSCVRELTRNPIDTHQVISPLIISGTTEYQTIWFAGATLDLSSGKCRHTNFGTDLAKFNTAPTFRKTDYATGAAVLIHYELFKSLGGFDPALFLYWEDTELSLKALQQGAEIIVNTNAIIWHLEGGSGAHDSGRSNTFYRYYARNRIIVSLRYTSLCKFIFFSQMETLRLFIRPLVKEKESRFLKAFQVAIGTIAGWKIALAERRSHQGQTT